MRRVLVLNQYALPRSEPGGTRHVELFGRLDDWDFLIVSGNRNHYTQNRFNSADPHFRTVRVPPLGYSARSRVTTWVTWSLGAAVASLKGPRPDVVYASTPHLLAPLVGACVARACRVPLIVEVRDLWPESMVAAGLLRRGSTTYWALRALEAIAMRAADHVVVVTSGWEQHLSELGVASDRVTVIPNGADPADFLVADGVRERVRTELGLEQFTAVFAGAHGPKDGLEHIMDAAAQVSDVDFLLVGDGSAKAAAINRCEREGLNNVRFLDPVSKDKLPRILAAADAGIHSVSPLPVFQLGMSPNKVFDYLAAGLPVVSNAGQPVHKLIGTHESAYVGSPGSLIEGLRYVRSLSEDPHLRRQRAPELIGDFSRESSARRLQDVLLETVARSGR